MEIKTLICGIFLLLFLSVTANLAYAITETQTQDAEKLFDEGKVLSNSGRYEEALIAYVKAIEINPQHDEAWKEKGFSLGNLGRYEEALTAFNKAIEINPQDGEAWYNKGVTLWNLGKSEEALTAYDKAIEINPQDGEAWYNKGAILGILGRFEESLIALNKVIKINPQHAKAWHNKGSTLGNLGRYEEALTAFDKAIEINPQYDEAWYNKGVIFNNMGRYEESLTAYYKAIEINPQNAKAWYNKGAALNILGKQEDAKLAFDKASEIDPEYTELITKKIEIQILKPEIYVVPSTGQIINRLILNIQPLFDSDSIGVKSKSIELNYIFEGSNINYKFNLNNNSYYSDKIIQVDLNQNDDYPFEYYNATIFISTNHTNSVKETFFAKPTYEKLTFDAWGEVRVLSILRKDNKIEITMERANKNESKMLYRFGFFILVAYLITYCFSSNKPDIFADFQSFSFVFFVTFVIAGVRDTLLNFYGVLFLFLIILFIGIFIYKRFISKKNYISEFEKEHKILRNDLQEMLNQKDEKLTEIIKSLKDDVKKLKSKRNRRRR